MNRRDFFRRTAGAVVLATLAPLLAKPNPRLMFHPDSFSLVMDPIALEDTVALEQFRERYIVPAMQAWFDQMDANLAKQVYGL